MTLSAALEKHFAKVAQKRALKGLFAPQVLVKTSAGEYRSGAQELPFHAASVGKLATAALVMQDVEAGRYELSTSVSALLPAAELYGLFANDTATVEQLLGHTAGVQDYFAWRGIRGGAFTKQVVKHPEHHWLPAELLDYTRKQQQPISEPGEKFRYSDTGFVLLGRILEEQNEATFTSLLRQRIFEPAGMGDTVLWLREQGPTKIAPAFLGSVDVSGFESLSCDWAGGGIVTTLDDAAQLIIALREGILLRPDSWNIMCTPRNKLRGGIYYGLGAMQLRFAEFSPFLRGLPRPVGHAGVFGVHAFSYPDSGAVVVLNFGGTKAMPASFRSHIKIALALRNTQK
ncbi:class A beta-lactamase-related serine hydrolase [Leucobacter sp. OH2974_COT-288]|uniref:D-alanyl-D-alanine carboxypeptidase n=1 Tax=Canibacter oris TaxID=1365628 RepID=A0A840DQG7_9MICO|nr:serine hydrolase domain-containing protein [Canibacter oris]MBB4071436.1 D-alanyl-D-alanine carboxypeptidase [Canibacter oris]RRD35705.1 class A beta-lactamase-related serine hydrolase [Leucobacter sp. OH2974_COT-288]